MRRGGKKWGEDDRRMTWESCNLLSTKHWRENGVSHFGWLFEEKQTLSRQIQVDQILVLIIASSHHILWLTGGMPWKCFGERGMTWLFDEGWDLNFWIDKGLKMFSCAQVLFLRAVIHFKAFWYICHDFALYFLFFSVFPSLTISSLSSHSSPHYVFSFSFTDNLIFINHTNPLKVKFALLVVKLTNLSFTNITEKLSLTCEDRIRQNHVIACYLHPKKQLGLHFNWQCCWKWDLRQSLAP